MKKFKDRERVTFYLRIGAAYLSLWLFSDLVSNRDVFLQRVANNIWLACYVTVINFLLFEYTLPFIKFTWKRLLVAPFLLFGYLLLFSFGLYAWRSIGIGLNIYTELIIHAGTQEGIAYHIPYGIFSIFFFGVIRYTYDYRRLRKAADQLRMEKQEAELNYLKSQTNPHFLFNTLNNIYSLSRDKSDLAPESILRLSKILRFMLYEAGGAYISLEQELKVISDYIALEKLRYDESLRINFNYDVEDMNQAIPPLLLIPLVENAFKHGVSETRNQPFVDIHLSVQRRQLAFNVRNSTDVISGERAVIENIGIKNLRRQLELLYKDYQLVLQQGESTFTATLNINLSSHV